MKDDGLTEEECEAMVRFHARMLGARVHERAQSVIGLYRIHITMEGQGQRAVYFGDTWREVYLRWKGLQTEAQA